MLLHVAGACGLVARLLFLLSLGVVERRA